MNALEVLRAFRAAFITLIGSTPSNSTLAILVAQSALECARWASMHCYNFGNMRPPAAWGGFYCQFRCNEKINGAWVWFDPPSPGSNFVAFEQAADGAWYYLTQLQRRWPEAWAAALAGDATGFVHGLKQRGYFTADEAPYRVGVQRLCKEFFDDMARGLVTDDAPVPPAVLPVGGDHASVAASSIVIAPALLIGAKGPAVISWLNAIGATRVTDTFDDAAVEATKAWQLQHGLPVTGAVCEPDLQAAGLLDPHDTDPSELAPH